MDIMKGEGNGQ